MAPRGRNGIERDADLEWEALQRAKRECFICREDNYHRDWCPVIAPDRKVERTLDMQGYVVREQR